MNWTVRRRLTALGLLSTFLILAGGGVCWLGVDQACRNARDLAMTAQALRDHVDVVSAEQAIRADVLASVVATDPEGVVRALQQF